MRKILVTGAAGFIGSAFCRLILSTQKAEIFGLDAMTYAASPRTLSHLQALKGFTFIRADIRDAQKIESALQQIQPDAIVHFAAESHVDRSIDSPESFIQTNIIGTFTLLEAARRYWLNLEDRDSFRFLHISTDEVYGSLGESGFFSEATPYAPNSPYSASKASSDHLVRAWHETYGLPTLISNCSNNYGSYQFPEKLIPTMIIKALNGQKLPVYGKGDNIRDWLYVDNHAHALWEILTRGRVGEKYLIGGDGEKTNLELVQTLCQLLDDKHPAPHPYSELISFVTDRPGHDKRYAIDYSKIKKELGWEPKVLLPEGLALTVDWYLANEEWWKEIQAQKYAGERQGLST